MNLAEGRGIRDLRDRAVRGGACNRWDGKMTEGPAGPADSGAPDIDQTEERRSPIQK